MAQTSETARQTSPSDSNEAQFEVAFPLALTGKRNNTLRYYRILETDYLSGGEGPGEIWDQNFFFFFFFSPHNLAEWAAACILKSAKFL